MFNKSQSQSQQRASSTKPNSRPPPGPPPRKSPLIESQPIQYDAATNAKLNNLYKGYLKNQQRPSMNTYMPSQTLNTRQIMKPRENEYEIHVNRATTLKTESQVNNYVEATPSQDPSSFDQGVFQDKEIDVNDFSASAIPHNSQFRSTDPAGWSSRRNDINNYNHSSMMIQNSNNNKDKMLLKQQVEAQVSLLKVKLESVLFQEFQNSEENVLKSIKYIGERTAKMQLRVARIFNQLDRVFQKVGKHSSHIKQNKELVAKIKELTAKIDTLQSENRSLKNNKDMERLRDSLHRARNNNSQHQERGVTPGRDRNRFEIENKLLLKQIVDAKRAKETAEAELLEKQGEIEDLIKSYHDLLEFSKGIEEKMRRASEEPLVIPGQEDYEQVKEKGRQLEKEVEVMGFQNDRLQATILQLNKKQEITNSELEKRQNDLRQMSKERQRELDEYIQRIQSLQKQLNAKQNKNIQVSSELLTLRSKMDKVERHSAKTEEELKKKITVLELEVKSLQEQRHNQNKAVTSELKDHKSVAVSMKAQLQSLKGQCEGLRQEISKQKAQHEKLDKAIIDLESELQDARHLIEQKDNEIQKLSSQTSSKSLQSQIVSCLKSLIAAKEPTDLPVNSRVISAYLLQLHEKQNKLSQQINQLELENKKMQMHKNKLDHILHQEPSVQYSEFETTAMDAFYFRQKKTTDQGLKDQLKRVAARLDRELEDNIKNKAQVIRLNGECDDLKGKLRMGKSALYKIVQGTTSDEQAIVLMSVLGIVQNKQTIKSSLVRWGRKN